MNAFLQSLLSEERWRGHVAWGSWLCGGSPLRDPACELLFKQGLPRFRKALLVNWGGGAWTGLLNDSHGFAESLHLYCEDAFLSERNARGCPHPHKVGHRVWYPGMEAPSDWGDVDFVLVRMWKEMDYNLAWLGALMSIVPSGCQIQFIGHKEDGIRNLEKRLEAFAPTETLAIGCHSRWISIANPGNVSAHVFPEPASGLFGGGRIDAGTHLLLEHAGDVKGLSVCDLGCGSGAIAEWVLQQKARSVIATDHQYLAVAAAGKRLQAFSSQAWSAECLFMGDGLEPVFDLVLTNPPFHLQKKTHLSIGSVWLKAACRLLRPGGQIRLVCNEFLDYARFAADLGLSCRLLAVRDGFRVYELSV